MNYPDYAGKVEPLPLSRGEVQRMIQQALAKPKS